MRNKKYLIYSLIMATFLWEGCHRADKGTGSMLTGEAVITADEAFMPLINAELDVFHNIYTASSIDCKYLPEDQAINLLLKEEVRLAVVGRPLNEKEVNYFKSMDIIPESIPLAYDAIALIVPASNTVGALTTDQIKQILSGSITDWNQITNSGKTGTIQIVFDTESSGIIRYLDEKLGLENKISGNFKFAGSNQSVVEMIAANTDGIGFVGYNWLSETESIKVQETLNKVHFVGVFNKSAGNSAVMPSVSSLYNNTYPLIRKVYAIYTDPAASLARGFLALLTSERGQRIIYRNGLKSEYDFQRLIKINEDF